MSPRRRTRKDGDVASARRLRGSTIAQRPSVPAVVPAKPSSLEKAMSSHAEASSSQAGLPLDGENVSSLCFYDAAIAFKENTINEDQYLHALLAHCTGLRHGKNQFCNGDTMEPPDFWNPAEIARDWPILYAHGVFRVDSFASKVAEFIAYCVNETNPAHDTEPIFQVLKAFRADDEAAFRNGIINMDEKYPPRPKYPRSSYGPPLLSRSLCHYLGVEAISEGKLGILKAMIDILNGHMGMAFEEEYYGLKAMPKTNRVVLRVIDASKFRPILPGRQPFNGLN